MKLLPLPPIRFVVRPVHGASQRWRVWDLELEQWAPSRFYEKQHNAELKAKAMNDRHLRVAYRTRLQKLQEVRDKLLSDEG